MNRKVTVVGAGNVGATTAQLIAEKGVADVVLVDILDGIPQGKSLDMTEAAPVWNTSARVFGANDYGPTEGSDVVVVTAGLARKPGMSRDDLLHANARIVRAVASEVGKRSPEAVIIVVSNPMDVMTQVVFQETGFPARRVVGMGGVLDSARFRAFVAMEAGVSARDVSALVMGGHGDSMVPLPRYTMVGGIPVTEILDKARVQELIERTRNGGAEIVGLLKSGSAYYAPAAASAEMAEAVLRDEKRVLPCAAYLEGQYGVTGVYSGVPVKLGAGGVEAILELKLSDEELKAFQASARAVQEAVSKLGESKSA
ncbi:MAG: malate dehydrogenase [Thermodesulfobacteriota bacterium]